MRSALLQFNTLPRIGFAHHFNSNGRCTVYGKWHTGLEIAYVTEGHIRLELNGEVTLAPAGSVVVLFRTLPFTLSCNAYQSHYTVQADLEFDLTWLDETAPAMTDCLLLPPVTPPCEENEIIKRQLLSIISDLGASREDSALSASLLFLDCLRRLDKTARQAAHRSRSPATLISYRVKRYVAGHLSRPITLQEIADELGKTSNYINRSFREANGITINRYIGQEKVRLMGALMRHQKLPFKSACENAGITDTAYGYRLFKKHTGVTPGRYLQGESYTQND